MYCKLFTSLYQGTLRGKSDEILVFTNLLAHCDSEGYVDKHWRAISEETGISEDRVRVAISALESPDPESRSPDREGRRITRIDDHRAWGWQVTNYVKYREIKNLEDRREQNREAQRRWRDKQKKVSSVSAGKQDKPMQMQYADAEVEAVNANQNMGKPSVPKDLAEVIAYGRSPHCGLTVEESTACFDHYSSTILPDGSWQVQGQRVSDWKARVRTWKNNRAKFAPRTRDGKIIDTTTKKPKPPSPLEVGVKLAREAMANWPQASPEIRQKTEAFINSLDRSAIIAYFTNDEQNFIIENELWKE